MTFDTSILHSKRVEHIQRPQLCFFLKISVLSLGVEPYSSFIVRGFVIKFLLLLCSVHSSVSFCVLSEIFCGFSRCRAIPKLHSKRICNKVSFVEIHSASTAPFHFVSYLRISVVFLGVEPYPILSCTYYILRKYSTMYKEYSQKIAQISHHSTKTIF